MPWTTVTDGGRPQRPPPAHPLDGAEKMPCRYALDNTGVAKAWTRVSMWVYDLVNAPVAQCRCL
eukprot:1395917-Pyramimonas_sp.AAC.1